MKKVYESITAPRDDRGGAAKAMSAMQEAVLACPRGPAPGCGADGANPAGPPATG